ncbi:MAG: alpha/beta hydrolase, partial [Dehalococcoidia bacterium]|nr:alpha/beta hydrolase [Dehalococcoidia bacterium]
PTAKVGDINIYYEIYGKGEPLVLIYGYAGHSGLWFRQIPVLSKKYQVVAFDNRGVGRSDKPHTPYTMAMMAGDVAGLLDVVGVDAAHIFGISLGGMVAQHFALGYPQRVISLILGCTFCGGVHSIQPEPESMAALFDFERLKKMTHEEVTRQAIPFCYSQKFIEEHPDLIEQRVAKQLEYPTPGHGATRQAEAVMGHDTYELLPRIRLPTLVIAGDNDRLIPVENSRILASRIPKAELAIIRGAGHEFFIEDAEEVNKTILDFLGRHKKGKKL